MRPKDNTDTASPSLTLASASPRRHELLALFGLPFRIQAAHIDEARRAGETPEAYATRMSREKAAAVDRAGIIIAADTVVAINNDVLDKPKTAEEARRSLERLRTREHRVITAVTVIYGNTMLTDLAISPVTMRPYTDGEIDAYIASGDPFDKAGAYAIQNADFHPVKGFNHCYANVMGLPLCHLLRMLRRIGIQPPADVPSACQHHLAYACPVYEAILSQT
ncbi:MAG: septum formation protein Maf [Chloroflexi bacterium]|nr:septum formation protein Maf [Chloroflexota bacterium]